MKQNSANPSDSSSRDAKAQDSGRRPSKRDLQLSLVAFLAAVLFAATGIASESGGAHWLVGVMSVTGVVLCVYLSLRLHGLNMFTRKVHSH